MRATMAVRALRNELERLELAADAFPREKRAALMTAVAHLDSVCEAAKVVALREACEEELPDAAAESLWIGIEALQVLVKWLADDAEGRQGQTVAVA